MGRFMLEEDRVDGSAGPSMQERPRSSCLVRTGAGVHVAGDLVPGDDPPYGLIPGTIRRPPRTVVIAMG
jgi:hypothetical protein